MHDGQRHRQGPVVPADGAESGRSAPLAVIRRLLTVGGPAQGPSGDRGRRIDLRSRNSERNPTVKIPNYGSHLRMSPAIVGVDKRRALVAGIPEIRFMNARSLARDQGKPEMAIAGLDVAELAELALLWWRLERWRAFSRACSGSVGRASWCRCFTQSSGCGCAARGPGCPPRIGTHLDQRLSRPLPQRRGGQNPQGVVAAGRDRRDRRPRHRALRPKCCSRSCS